MAKNLLERVSMLLKEVTCARVTNLKTVKYRFNYKKVFQNNEEKTI